MAYHLLKVCFLLFAGTFAYAFNFQDLKHSLKKRSEDVPTSEPIPLGCLEMVSFEGEFSYDSPGAADVCGLYLIALPDQVIEISVTQFSVNCDNMGLIAMVDGWEMQGQSYPGVEDHEKTLDERYTTYCGAGPPTKLFRSSQNVALLQFSLPTTGDRFTISIRFHRNPQPCHAVSMLEEGTVTMTNFGGRRNCTLSIISPEKVQLVSIDVGQTPVGRSMQLFETGTVFKCQKRQQEDYLELLTGNGLDPAFMRRILDMCGRSYRPESLSWYLRCHHSMLRLVSSGRYYNTATLHYMPSSEWEGKSSEELLC